MIPNIVADMDPVVLLVADGYINCMRHDYVSF
jgi:hypothetical protein